MAREVSVRLSADISAYLTAMGQAEQATSRVADAADRLGEISISADSSVAADLDTAASSADAAASSMESAAGSAESMSGGMDDAAASAQGAAGGLQEAGAASDNVAASVGQVSAASVDTTAAMMAVGSAAQDSAAGLQSAGAASENVAASVGQVSASSRQVAADMLAVSASAQDAAGGMESAGASAASTGAGFDTAGASAQQAGAGLESAGASAQVLSSNLDGSGASAQSFASSLSTVGAQSQDAAGAMQSLSGAAQDSAGGLDTAAGAAGSTSASMGALLSDITGMQSEFRALGGAMAVVGGGLTAMAGSLISTGIEYNNLQQVAGQALSTMTDSAGEAAAQMERFDDFARNSPFFRDTWLTAQQQLMAFGMEAERVVPTLEGIEEAVAAIGGGDQEIRQLVDILGQVQGQGRITGRELQRMGQMGIDAASIIGEQMGYTGDQIREQITAGALDAETAIDALAAGMSSRFEGSGDAIRNTFEGAKNDVIAFTRDIGSIIATPLVNPEGGGFLVDIMNMAGDALLALRDVNPVLIQVAGLGAAAAGGIGLLGGVFALAAPQIATFTTGAWNALTAIRDLGAGLVNAAGGWRRFATGAGIAVAAIAGLAILRSVNTDSQDVAASVEDMRRELVLAADGARAFTDIEWSRAGEDSSNHVSNLTEAFQRLDSDGIQGVNDSVNRFFSNLLGIDGAITDLDESIANVDEALANAFTSGDFDYAAAGFEQVADAAADADWTVEELAEKMPQLTAAIQDAAINAGVTADATQLLGIATSEAALEALAAGESWNVINRAYETGEYTAGLATGEILSLRDALSQQAEAANEAADAISALTDDMGAYAGIALEAEATTDEWLASLRELEAAISDDADALAELEAAYANGEITQEQYRQGLEDITWTLDENTDAGAEQRAMLRDLAEGTWDAAAATAAQEGSLEDVNGVIDTNIQALRDAGEAAGLTEDEIDEMIRTYMGFNEVEPIEIQAENRAQEIFDEVETGLNSLPDDWEIRINALADDAQEVINALVEGDYEAVAKILGDDELARAVIDAFADGDYEAVARIMADPMEANRVVYDFTNGEYVATADIDGNTNPADVAMAAFLNGDYQTVAEITGNDAEARATILAFLNGDYQTTAHINGNDSPAQGTMGSFIGTSWQTTVGFNGNDSSARGTMNSFTGTPWSTTAIINGNDGPARGTMGDFTGTAWSTIVGVNANTSSAQSAIARLSGQSVTVNVRTAGAGIGRGLGNLLGGGAAGGRAGSLSSMKHLPAFSTGGRLQSTGLGTDSILGISRSGTPTAWVDDREWIINQRASDKYDRTLAAINADHPSVRHLASYADGGRARSFPASGHVQSAPAIDYDRLAGAMAAGPRVVFQQTNHNPLRETDIEAARRQVEAVGMDWDMSSMGGER